MKTKLILCLIPLLLLISCGQKQNTSDNPYADTNVVAEQDNPYANKGQEVKEYEQTDRSGFENNQSTPPVSCETEEEDDTFLRKTVAEMQTQYWERGYRKVVVNLQNKVHKSKSNCSLKEYGQRSNTKALQGLFGYLAEIRKANLKLESGQPPVIPAAAMTAWKQFKAEMDMLCKNGKKNALTKWKWNMVTLDVLKKSQYWVSPGPANMPVCDTKEKANPW